MLAEDAYSSRAPEPTSEGEHSGNRSEVLKEYTQEEYDYDNEGEEESIFLSHLMDLAVGTPEMIGYRQDYCQLYDHLFKDVEGSREYYTGSKAEGLDLPGSDEDYMFYDPTILVLQSHEENKSSSHSTSRNVFVMETDDIKPCFTLLRHTGGPISELVYSLMQPINNISYLSSYLYVMSNKGMLQGAVDEIVQGPSLETYTKYSTEGRDFVHCLECDFWPLQANEWLHRHRPSGWPSENITQRILEQGCHLVAVGHPLSERKEMEWRLSFSIAERTLVWSFSHVQMQCYAFLKILLKEYIKPKLEENILCSYFVKTIMFWEVELKSSLFWTEGNLTTCLTHLVRKLYGHVVTGHLRHYFIPAFNLFEIKVKGAARRKVKYIMEALLGLDTISIMTQCKSFDTAMTLYSEAHSNKIQIMDKLDEKLQFMALECNMNFTFRVRIYIDLGWKSVCTTLHTLDRNNAYFEHSKECVMIRLIEWIYSRNSNKTLYRMHRLLQYSLYSSNDMLSRKLCVVSWLFLSRNFLKCLSLVSNALSSIPTSYVYMSNFKIRNSKDQVAMSVDVTGRDVALGRSNQRYWLFDLKFTTEDIGIVPAAIQVELVYCDPDVAVDISPFVYLYYLQFLCYHGLHDYTNRDRALHQLIETANSDEQSGDLVYRPHSYNIAGHCLWFVERYSEARDMFINSPRITHGTVHDQYNSARHYLDMITGHV